MTTGVPLLVHGPQYSSITNYIKEKNAGYTLESIDLSDIELKIKEIMRNSKGHNELAKTAQRVQKEELSSKVMKHNFLTALGILE